MLDWFQSFFSSIGDTIKSLLEFVISLLESLFDLIEMLPTVVSMLVSSIGYLPGILALFATLSISISIIYLVAGRNNN